MTHVSRIKTTDFAKLKGKKSDLRAVKADRNYKEGDELLLQEYDEDGKKFTGAEVKGKVTSVITSEKGNGIRPNWTLLQFEVTGETAADSAAPEAGAQPTI